jgi:hypothetical protein
MTDSTPPNQVVDSYEKRIAELKIIENSASQLDKKFGVGRVVVFLVFCLVGLLGFLSEENGLPLRIGAAFLFVAFVVVALWHDRILNQLELTRTRRLVNERRIARWKRDWSNLPLPKIDLPPEVASLSADLNLFDRASLFQWLCVANTPMGRETLRDWILQPASPEVIRDRQRKVQSLVDQVQWREDLEVTGKLLAASPRGPRAFMEFAESEIWQDNRPVLRWIARILPLSMIALFGGALFGLLPPGIGWIGGIGVIVLQAIVGMLHTGNIHDIFDSIAAKHREVWHYVNLLGIVSELPADVADSQGIDIRSTARDAVPELARLGRISNFAAARHDAIFGALFFVGSLLFLIDFHILTLVEIWQRRCGSRVRQWFDAIGDLEAFACLANVVHDHPDWTFPQVDPGETHVVARELGHPLIGNDIRVGNTVEVGPRGRFLLVSGSNMSGKSTLLRSIGISSVLAQMGGPVAAKEFRLPPLKIATSMRVADSLEDGVSFFMAELQRLKEIVDMSRQTEDGRVLFFLLDEILQGTNSVERHIAVVRVLRHLTKYGATGAISTHDLDLAKSEDLTPHCDTVNFREQISSGAGGGEMTFDYIMRDGVATTTNALRLLELVGLNELED